MMATRKATHAGSWYSDNPAKLREDLNYWLEAAEVSNAPAKAIIAPHAGYQFSGPCAGYAYKQIDPSLIKRIFILGPSHHKYLSTCALSKAIKYETPFCDLKIDAEVNNELMSTGEFEFLSLGVEQHEHSIEMQLPYIAKVMEEYDLTIVPILVGNLSVPSAIAYGRILSKYFADPHNLFVISSDFCHWGKVFKYTYLGVEPRFPNEPIYEIIEDLDKMAMKSIEHLDANWFRAYLNQHCTTICGRNPILVFLHTVTEFMQTYSFTKATLKFLRYEQSHQCNTIDDSSVSYAAASLVIQ